VAEGLKRRDFVRKVALSGAGLLVLRNSKAAWSYQANNKLNIAFVGAGGRGAALIDEFAKLGENIVALCDVDWNMAAGSFQKFPNAKRYFDFRKMLDEMHNQIDAVVVATADHTHAVAFRCCDEVGQACLLRKAAHLLRLGSEGHERSRQEAESRHSNGQPRHGQ
jgi:FlaA1/EpsC-like NDP-sugar epimerase